MVAIDAQGGSIPEHRRPRFLPPGRRAERDMLAEVNVLFDQMIRDHELVLAIRASELPACRAVGDWLAASDFKPKVLPVPASEFYWTLSRAISIACLEMQRSRVSFDQLFPRQPMLPSVEWPILWQPRGRRRQENSGRPRKVRP
jgi:hypothetical protein